MSSSSSRPRRTAKPSVRAKEVADTTKALKKADKASAAEKKAAKPKSAAKKKAATKTKATAAAATRKRKQQSTDDDDDDDSSNHDDVMVSGSDHDDDTDDGKPTAAKPKRKPATKRQTATTAATPTPPSSSVRPTTKRAAAAAAAKQLKATAADSHDHQLQLQDTKQTTKGKGKSSSPSSAAAAAVANVASIVAIRQRLNIKGEVTRWRFVIHSPPVAPNAASARANSSTANSTAMMPLTKLEVGDSSSHYFMVTYQTNEAFCNTVDVAFNAPYSIRVRPLPIDCVEHGQALLWCEHHLRGHAKPAQEIATIPQVIKYTSVLHNAIDEFRRLSGEANTAAVASKPAKKSRAASGEKKSAATAHDEWNSLHDPDELPFPTSSSLLYVKNGAQTRHRRSIGLGTPPDAIGRVTGLDGVLVMDAKQPPLYSGGPVTYTPGTYDDIDASFIDLLGDYGYAEDMETRAEDNLSICSGDTMFEARHSAAAALKQEGLDELKHRGETIIIKNNADDDDTSDDRAEGAVQERALFHKFIDMSNSNNYKSALVYWKQVMKPSCETNLGLYLPMTLTTIITSYFAPMVVTEDMIRARRVQRWIDGYRQYAASTADD